MRLKLFISLFFILFSLACQDKAKYVSAVEGRFIIQQYYQTATKESSAKIAKQLKGKGFEIKNGQFIYKNKTFKGFSFPTQTCFPVRSIEMSFVKNTKYPLLFNPETLEMSTTFAKIFKKDIDESIKVIILDCESYIIPLGNDYFAFYHENNLLLYKRNPYAD